MQIYLCLEWQKDGCDIIALSMNIVEHSPASLHSISFLIGKFHLTCSLQHDQLSLQAALPHSANASLSLTNLNQLPRSLQLTLQSLQLSPHTHPTSPHSTPITLLEVTTAQQNNTNIHLSTLGSQLTRIQDKLTQSLSQIQPPRLPFHSKQESSTVRKLQMLNQILQQKLLSRDNEVHKLNQRINEQEQLIKELADKFISSNQDRDEMYADYQKILSMTVFNQQQMEMRLSQMKSEKKIKRSGSKSDIRSEGEKMIGSAVEEKEEEEEDQMREERGGIDITHSVELPTENPKDNDEDEEMI